MQMIDMKRPKPKQSDKEAACCGPMCDEPYPYGMRLRLEKDELDKVPALAGKEVGDEVEIVCKAKVIEKRHSAEARGGNAPRESRTLELQVMALGVGGSLTDRRLPKK